MAGTIVADIIQSDQSYASSINIASPMVVSNTLTMGAAAAISGNVNFDSGTLFVNSVGNKVGVGTSNPDRLFHVHGNMRVGDGVSGEQDIEFYCATGTWQVGTNADVGTNQTNQFYVYDSNGTYRLKIDQVGRVTTPSQPAFHVTGTNYTQTVGGASKIIPSGEDLDIGGNYNVSTGRFTAPIAGVYQFGWWGLSYPHAADVSSLMYYKNGSGLYNNMQFGGQSTSHTGCAGTIVVSLAANDYIELYYSSGAGSSAKAYGSQWNMWGRLLG